MTPGSAALGHVRDRVDRALQAFIGQQRGVLLAAGDDLRLGAESIAGLLAGGKRLRPAFCYWGWRGAGGPDCPEIIKAAAALELLHAGALIHDDLMDASDTRRGQPSVHRQFEARHAGRGWHGSAGAFGMGMAILLGDLLICWTDEMFQTSGLPADALRRGRPVLDRMRTEVFAGQYLDLLGQAAGDETVAGALRVVEFKTAKYTIERPLHLGAALAGAGAAPAGPDGGPPAGGAVAGDGARAGDGAPAGDGALDRSGALAAGDGVREGKRTVLLAVARSRATAGQARVIDRYLGDPLLDESGTAKIRAAIAGTGAVAECERMITRHVSEAIAALDGAPITAEAREALAELAVAATARDG